MSIALSVVAPLQSWGDSSRFRSRATAMQPTKSGVVGLIASAMGLERDADVSALADISMAVRIDQAGRIASDFQTFRKGGPNPQLSTRWYLEDAAFLVIIEASDELEDQIEKALRTPHRVLYFGRRSCLPSVPIFAGRFDRSADELLAELPYLGEGDTPSHYDVVRDVRDDDDLDAVFTSVTRDVPLSFDSAARRYGSRVVVHDTVETTPEEAP